MIEYVENIVHGIVQELADAYLNSINLELALEFGGYKINEQGLIICRVLGDGDKESVIVFIDPRESVIGYQIINNDKVMEKVFNLPLGISKELYVLTIKVDKEVMLNTEVTVQDMIENCYKSLTTTMESNSLKDWDNFMSDIDIIDGNKLIVLDADDYKIEIKDNKIIGSKGNETIYHIILNNEQQKAIRDRIRHEKRINIKNQRTNERKR